MRIAISILTFAFAVRFAVTLFDWFIRLIVVTDQRFMLIAGLATTTVQTISFPNLADMTFQRARRPIFGFGTFTIESAGNTHAVINYVPYPEQIYLEIFSALFPGSAVLPDPAEAAPPRPGPAEAAPPSPGPASAGLGWPGPEAAGPEAAGPEAAGPEAAGPEAAGPEAAGPEAAGPEAAGPEAAGPEAAGPEAAGPEAAGPAGNATPPPPPPSR